MNGKMMKTRSIMWQTWLTIGAYQALCISPQRKQILFYMVLSSPNPSCLALKVTYFYSYILYSTICKGLPVFQDKLQMLFYHQKHIWNRWSQVEAPTVIGWYVCKWMDGRKWVTLIACLTPSLQTCVSTRSSQPVNVAVFSIETSKHCSF